MSRNARTIQFETAEELEDEVPGRRDPHHNRTGCQIVAVRYDDENAFEDNRGDSGNGPIPLGQLLR